MRRELYIDHVDGRLGDPAWRTSVVSTLRQHGFNGVKLYGTGPLFDRPATWSQLCDFLGLLRGAGIRHIGAAYGSARITERLDRFHASPVHTSNETRFDGVISEIEPWVPTSKTTWPEFITTLATMHQWARTTRIEASAYLGWPHSPAEQVLDENIGAVLSNVDALALHYYSPGSPRLGSMQRRRLEACGRQALLTHTPARPFPILAIYSAEARYSGAHLAQNGVVNTHHAFERELTALRFPGWECLDLSPGFVVFTHGQLVAAGIEFDLRAKR